MARLPGIGRAATLEDQRRVVLAVAMTMAVASAVRLPRVKNDPAVYLDALHRMRHGVGYYRAMDAAMRAFRIGPVESTRAFRPATAFLLWRWLPNDHLVWIAFLALTVVATIGVASMLRAPLLALLFTGYMIVVGTAGYSAPELWAVALIAVGLGLAWNRRPLPAILVLLLATSVRELAILALIGVVIDAWGRPHVRQAAAASAVALVGMYLVHSHGTAPFLVPAGQGREAHLLGSAQFPSSLLRMSGAWLPAGVVLGPLLLVLTLASLRASGRLRILLPLLALLLSGLVVHRPEWGMLVVPFTLTLGVDEALVLRREAAAQRAHTVDKITPSTGRAS